MSLPPLSLLLMPLLLPWLPPSAASVSECRRLNELLDRLSDLVDFYASDPDRVNSDGYFGMRLSRDLLAPSPVAEAAAARCGDSAGRRLQSVLIRQDLLAGRFAENLAGRAGYDGATFSRICEPMARRFQRLTGAPRFAIDSLDGFGGAAADRWPDGNEAVRDTVTRLIEYNEPRGDACLVKALQPEDGCQGAAQCPYFDQTLGRSSGYYLTHQLLYKLVKELGPCWSVDRLPDLASVEMASICGKVLSEFRLIEIANWTRIAAQMGNDSVTGLRDLYVEQALLCGLVGAKDFYRVGSVTTVASWQDPRLGCFKLYGGPAASATRDGGESVMRRRILRDVEMLGGCSAHTTGVAMGFYSNAIRYLLGV